MAIAQLRPARVEISRGRWDGDAQEKWFVTVIDEIGEDIVADCLTEAEALSAAQGWNLPVIVLRL